MDDKEKQELKEKVVKMKVIREKVIAGMEDKLNERYLYTIPYKELYLTSSEEPNKVGFSMQDAYVTVKQLEESEGNIKRLFEIYDSELNKVAETGADGRIKYDKEITDELVKMKQLLQKQNEEQGTNLEIAGLDKNGELEAYMQMMNHEIVSLTAEQKEKAEKGDKKDIGLDNKIDEQAANENDKKELQTKEIANDLGIEPDDIYQMTEIRDDAFLRSEGVNNGYELCAIKTRDGALHMVTKNSEGNYEKSKDFTEGTVETGRTTYATNDYNNLRETNTYGAIYFANDPNKRIAGIKGQYGALEIVKQDRINRNPNGPSMNTDEIWSPGFLIQTDNTAISDMDLNGEYSQTRVVSEKKDRNNYDMNKESATIREHGGENLKVQDIANDETRGMAAFERVQIELNRRGIDLSTEDKEALEREFTEKGVTYCDEEVQEFCDKYEVDKKNEEQEEKEAEKDKSEQDKSEPEEEEERTLAGDALKRLYGGHH